MYYDQTIVEAARVMRDTGVGAVLVVNGESLSGVVTDRDLVVRQADIPSVRHFATLFGVRAGMGAAQMADFVLAVSEAAACATLHGPCTATLRLWTTQSRALCEIRGTGVLRRPGPGQQPRGDAEALRRWLLQQVCDYVSVDSGADGVTVRFSMAVA